MNLLKRIIIKLLTIEAKLIINKYKPFVVAVTGSVGKTSTKDAIFEVLRDSGKYVRKSEKSLNSDIGLPLTIIGVPNAWRSVSGWLKNVTAAFKLIVFRSDYPDVLVLEIGADHPGDIRSVAKWLKTDIAVITKISRTPVHVEFFGSPEQVFEEKACLIESLKDRGSLVLFADDDKVSGLDSRLKAKNVRVFRFGTKLSIAANVVSCEEVSTSMIDGRPVGLQLSMMIGSEKVSVNIIGDSYKYPVMAAATVGLARSMNASKIAGNLSAYYGPKGRMNLVKGLNQSTIIDDTYNSSPDAVISALNTLKSLNISGQKIAILGDMMELGKYSAQEHRNIGKTVVSLVDFLITVGPRSKMTAHEAVEQGMDPRKASSYDNSYEVIEKGLPALNAGDVVLVKGSQSVRMERIVKALMAEPDRASELIVRQEREWLEKK